MGDAARPPGKLLAISDLHVRYPENRAIVADLRPTSDRDWLVVAGDVAELVSDVESVLRTLAGRFARVIWTPGNHELWTVPGDPVRLRGEHRYRHLVEIARRLGVATPEDPYPVWDGPGGPAVVAPLLLLYDYTFRPDGAVTTQQALARAFQAGVVCTDEALLHPDGHTSIATWCGTRVAATERRLAACDPDLPLVLVNHYPLVRGPTEVLRFPEFALWCGTAQTADWHRRFRTEVVVYGHLHIPRTTWHDGVRFEEVSLGYPREWRRRSTTPGRLRQILPRE
jgi:3',5'-cyclic AMP phosphodiesterase CpdA